MCDFLQEEVIVCTKRLQKIWYIHEIKIDFKMSWDIPVMFFMFIYI